jgi:alkaline phosphatase D
MRTRFAAALLLAGAAAAAAAAATGSPAARWDSRSDRRWAGPSIWCNRLQDWRLRGGRLSTDNREGLPVRTAHLVTYELADRREPFRLSVVIHDERLRDLPGFVGFLAGAGQGRLDYRGAALVHHLPGKGGGILAVIDTGKQARPVFRDMSAETNAPEYPLLGGQRVTVEGGVEPERGAILLILEGTPAADGYDLRLEVRDDKGGKLLSAAELRGVDGAKLRGNVALVSHGSTRTREHQFEAPIASGGRLEHHPERAFGPIVGTLYTVANGTLKLSAQFVPLESGQNMAAPELAPARRPFRRHLAVLERRRPDGQWETADGPKPIVGPDYCVQFRVGNWDSTREADTRVTFDDSDGSRYEYATRVARDPADQDVVSVAGFTGMGSAGRIASHTFSTVPPASVVIGRWTPANIWAPFAEAVRALEKQKIDILAFTGDQIYEDKPTFPDNAIDPIEDYLYRWLLWHWSFRSLTSRVPALVQPDDHDVYQGNLFGWGGRLNLTGHNGEGGYMRAPGFVNLVHHMQTGHLPDAYDPAPALNGITNYYTRLAWGGVGFAVLEDRKFKTPPHVQDAPQQVLLGDRQQQMLREWGAEWTGQQVKCVVSQTIYASLNVGTAGGITRDTDTNGFPKAKRDEAVRLFRTFGAFVLGGDQHLATFSRIGIASPTDGVYQFSVPALGNIFWRWFYPEKPGAEPLGEAPEYTGNFTDGFGNPFRMLAVANPERRALRGQMLRQRFALPEEEAKSGLGDEFRVSQGDGYGIVRFDKRARKLTVECWPYRGGNQYRGWPKSVGFDELDGREPVAWLPDLDLSEMANAVVEIIDESNGQLVKASRVSARLHSPGVFAKSGSYTLRAGIPEQRRWWTVKGLKPSAGKGASKLRPR